MKQKSLVIILASLGIFFIGCLSHRSDRKLSVDYNFDVRPILSDKCFACHGPDSENRAADLRFDIPEGPFKPSSETAGGFAIVKGEPESSLLIERIFSDDPSQIMPPLNSHLKLSNHEKEVLREWIKQGAEYKTHWAFVAPQKASPPAAEWSTNPIDQFVYDKMYENGLEPNPEADPYRLLKRLSFDLIGLPPTVEMQERFAADPSLNNYESIVDELLESKHYGEKMAMPWLDAARYADSHGYQDDGMRTMWPWRDWVIHAFNQNYSYKKFTEMQIAGDLIKNSDKESLLATGFNRNHKITQEGGVIDEEYRIEYVTDRTNTFGKTFLALTFECAKCHDHKYDPISQEEYFSTFAFFDKVPEKGLYGTIDFSFADPPKMEITDEDVASILDFVNKQDSSKLEVMVMKDSLGIRPTQVLARGAYDAKTDTVECSTPKAVMTFDTTEFSADRLGLVDWLFDESNPLTARVFVNRVWAIMFGRGIVNTVGDFGMQGDLPTHPELLDWLAADFAENGWDIKRMVKQLVMTKTYRQSAVTDKAKIEKDPENFFLSRSSRIRFSAETVRDHVLASSGLMHDEIGGPSVKPYQPEGLWAAASSGRGTLQSYVQDKGNDLYRRGMYTFIKRTVPPPVMLTFDASTRDQCEVRRLNTNTPLQALVMLNDPTVMEASKYMASELLATNVDINANIQEAVARIICRPAKNEELKALNDFYTDQLKVYQDPELRLSILGVGETVIAEEEQTAELAAMMQVIQMIYNLDEAITKT